MTSSQTSSGRLNNRNTGMTSCLGLRPSKIITFIATDKTTAVEQQLNGKKIKMHFSGFCRVEHVHHNRGRISAFSFFTVWPWLTVNNGPRSVSNTCSRASYLYWSVIKSMAAQSVRTQVRQTVTSQWHPAAAAAKLTWNIYTISSTILRYDTVFQSFHSIHIKSDKLQV